MKPYLPLCPACRRLFLATLAEQIAGICVPCERKNQRTKP